MSEKKTPDAPKAPKAPEPLTLAQKLLQMQQRVDTVIKDGRNTSDKYDFASDENVLDAFRPMMDELGLLLIPDVESAVLHEGTTKSGTTRYLTEMFFNMTWLDAVTGETMPVRWYGQGVDLAGEKGVGKAATYAEKYFLLKFFHVPTRKDDPDDDRRTTTGEKRQSGTAAARENVAYMRLAIPQMVSQLYPGDEEKQKAYLVFITKSESRGYPGVDNVPAISDAALPVAYGKIKKAYEKNIGHPFELKQEEASANA